MGLIFHPGEDFSNPFYNKKNNALFPSYSSCILELAIWKNLLLVIYFVKFALICYKDI